MAIGDLFLQALREELGARDVVPILVLRGGLTLYPAVCRRFSTAAIGVVVPERSRESITLRYVNVPPLGRGQRYLLLDQLLGSGDTMRAVLSGALRRPADGDQVAIGCPFCTREGIERLLREFPRVSIHAIWHRERLLPDGRVDGPGFDIGDCALGRITAAGRGG